MSTTSISNNGTYVIRDTEWYDSDHKYHQTRNDTFSSASAVVMYDSHTDPIKRRRPSGWVAPLAYSKRFYQVERARGTMSETIFPSGNTRASHFNYRTSNIGLQPASADPALKEIFADNSTNFSADIAKAELQALLKLKNQQFNAGVALGESRQLAHHIGNTATKLAKSYSALRRGNWRSAGKHLGLKLKSQPGNWLELQYGWKPLLSDVHGAASALSQRNDRGDWVTTVKASVSRTVTVADEYSTVGTTGPWYSRRRSDMYGVYVRLDFHPSSFDYLHIPAALGLTNPASVAWELVPFSFVVDWFAPVGDWLNALDATLGYSFLSGTRSTIRRRTGQYRASPAYTHSWVSSGMRRYWSGDASASLYQVELDRTLYASPPTPALRIKNPVSPGHMANGLGLLYQVFKLGRF